MQTDNCMFLQTDRQQGQGQGGLPVWTWSSEPSGDGSSGVMGQIFKSRPKPRGCGKATLIPSAEVTTVRKATLTGEEPILIRLGTGQNSFNLSNKRITAMADDHDNSPAECRLCAGHRTSLSQGLLIPHSPHHYSLLAREVMELSDVE